MPASLSLHFFTHRCFESVVQDMRGSYELASDGLLLLLLAKVRQMNPGGCISPQIRTRRGLLTISVGPFRRLSRCDD